jgi:hypothetical protein
LYNNNMQNIKKLKSHRLMKAAAEASNPRIATTHHPLLPMLTLTAIHDPQYISKDLLLEEKNWSVTKIVHPAQLAASRTPATALISPNVEFLPPIPRSRISARFVAVELVAADVELHALRIDLHDGIAQCTHLLGQREHLPHMLTRVCNLNVQTEREFLFERDDAGSYADTFPRSTIKPVLLDCGRSVADILHQRPHVCQQRNPALQKTIVCDTALAACALNSERRLRKMSPSLDLDEMQGAVMRLVYTNALLEGTVCPRMRRCNSTLQSQRNAAEAIIQLDSIVNLNFVTDPARNVYRNNLPAQIIPEYTPVWHGSCTSGDYTILLDALDAPIEGRGVAVWAVVAPVDLLGTHVLHSPDILSAQPPADGALQINGYWTLRARFTDLRSSWALFPYPDKNSVAGGAAQSYRYLPSPDMKWCAEALRQSNLAHLPKRTRSVMLYSNSGQSHRALWTSLTSLEDIDTGDEMLPTARRVRPRPKKRRRGVGGALQAFVDVASMQCILPPCPKTPPLATKLRTSAGKQNGLMSLLRFVTMSPCP